MSDRLHEQWTEEEIGSNINIQSGYPFSSDHFRSDGVGVPLIRIRDLLTQSPTLTVTTEVSTEFYINRGDLLVGMDGDFNIVKWKHRGAVLNQRVCKVEGNSRLDTDFLFHLLSDELPKINAQTGSTTVKHLATRDIASISSKLPPIKEQQKIAEILTSVDEVIENTQSQINKLEDLKKATMNELLTKGIGHTEFKETEIGRIPESWEIYKLEDLTLGRYGIVDGPFGSNLKTEHYRPQGIPVIQSGFVTSFEFKANSYVYIDQEKFNEQIRSSVSPNDIVMAKIGANAGTSAIVPSNHKIGILAGNSLKITVDTRKSLTRFIHHYLKWSSQTGRIHTLLTVTAQPAISLTALRQLLIPVPPLKEQQKIDKLMVELYGVSKGLRNKLDTMLSLKNGLMQDLLTGKVRVTVN
jgi:type I restriction enzyme S subunit